MNYSSPFLLFCNCNNLLNEKKEPEEEENYFCSQSTKNDSCFSQSNYFQSQSQKESQHYFEDIENSESQQQINLFVDTKILEKNPNIINSYIDKIKNIKFSDICDDSNSNNKNSKDKDLRLFDKKDNENNSQYKRK